MSTREEAHGCYAAELVEQLDAQLNYEITDRDLFQLVIDSFNGQPYCATWEDYLFITRKVRGIQNKEE